MSSNTTRGNFHGLHLTDWDRQMLESAFQAVESVQGGWDFLKTYEPPEGRGFMFSTPGGKGKEIDEEVLKRYGGHSGASYAGTMRVMQFIAINDWDGYVKERHNQQDYKEKQKTLEEKRKEFLALPFNMTLQEQAKALEEFKDVPMTYGEMRERFG